MPDRLHKVSAKQASQKFQAARQAPYRRKMQARFQIGIPKAKLTYVKRLQIGMPQTKLVVKGSKQETKIEGRVWEEGRNPGNFFKDFE